MSSQAAQAELQRLLDRLGPGPRADLVTATELALRLHADAVSLEHWIYCVVSDEDSAAHAAILHAFADPETIASEVLALAPGMMVVGSEGAIPFSPRCVATLRRAHGLARREGSDEVHIEHLVRCLVADMQPEHVQGLEVDAVPLDAEVVPLEQLEGSLFKNFDDAAKKAISSAAKETTRARHRSISPGHLLLACLGAKVEGPAWGLTALQLRARVRTDLADTSLPAARDLGIEADLARFGARLPPAADSVAVLTACHFDVREELTAVLTRHKVTLPFLERAKEAFKDG